VTSLPKIKDISAKNGGNKTGFFASKSTYIRKEDKCFFSTVKPL